MCNMPRLCAFLVALVCVCSAQSALAKSEPGRLGPVETVEAAFAQMNAAAEENSAAAVKDAKIRDLFRNYINFHELSRLAMGKYWGDLTDEEKNEFVLLFQKKLENAFVPRLHRVREVEIKVDRGDVSVNKNRAKVRSVMTWIHDRDQMFVTFELLQEQDGTWKIYNVFIPIFRNLVTFYRKQFEKRIEAKTLQKFLEKFREEMK